MALNKIGNLSSQVSTTLGKTPVYIINKNYKAFNNYFEFNHLHLL